MVDHGRRASSAAFSSCSYKLKFRRIVVDPSHGSPWHKKKYRTNKTTAGRRKSPEVRELPDFFRLTPCLCI
jgi:hypothetical protein